MPPRRSSATARAAAAVAEKAAAATAPMTAAAVEQLIEARVSVKLANHETLRNSTNGHGDGSHNSGTRIRGTTRTPQLALMCGRIFLEESDEVDKYVGALPDMIRGNGYQQQNKRQNTRRAYSARPDEKKEYTRSLPLYTKYNYHHKGPCAPRCNKCKKISHLAYSCRSSGPNNNNNNRGNSGATQNAATCY
ncbi:hypothetical protein Tco_0987925, partial [Tanacetum coccineum]